jgi:hypothetical protein
MNVHDVSKQRCDVGSGRIKAQIEGAGRAESGEAVDVRPGSDRPLAGIGAAGACLLDEVDEGLEERE